MQIHKLSSFNNKMVQEKNVRSKQLNYMITKANSNATSSDKVSFSARSIQANKILPKTKRIFEEVIIVADEKNSGLVAAFKNRFQNCGLNKNLKIDLRRLDGQTANNVDVMFIETKPGEFFISGVQKNADSSEFTHITIKNDNMTVSKGESHMESGQQFIHTKNKRYITRDEIREINDEVRTYLNALLPPKKAAKITSK